MVATVDEPSNWWRNICIMYGIKIQIIYKQINKAKFNNNDLSLNQLINPQKYQTNKSINNTILIMIRKVLNTLIKPNQALKNAHNKYLFAQSPKQAKETKVQDTKTTTPPQEDPSQSKPQQPKPKQQQQSDHDDEFVYEKQNRNTVGWWIYRFFFWGSAITLGYNLYLVNNHNKKTPVEEQPTAVPYFIDAAKWLNNEYHEKLKFFIEPPVKKFLPDPLHPSMQPKTLVLNLTGTLLKTDFVFGKGMTLQRRPGLNNLLKRLAQKYELVIFSDDDYMFLTTASEYLDPRNATFMGVFGRQSMIWHNGRYIKDLAYLNRDPKNVIVIDKDVDSVNKHPQNVIVLSEFQGDEKDDELIKLLPLLEKLAGPEVKDVRKELAKYGEHPHETYYKSLQEKKKNIEKKQSGMLGFFGGRSSAQQQPAKI